MEILSILKEGEIQMESNIEQPEIKLNFKEVFPSISDNYAQHLIDEHACIFFTDFNIMVLSYGIFTKQLLKKYNRTIEKQTCNTISHEIIHWVILCDLNIKACAKFDDIAESLADYGVY